MENIKLSEMSYKDMKAALAALPEGLIDGTPEEFLESIGLFSDISKIDDTKREMIWDKFSDKPTGASTDNYKLIHPICIAGKELVDSYGFEVNQTTDLTVAEAEELEVVTEVETPSDEVIVEEIETVLSEEEVDEKLNEIAKEQIESVHLGEVAVAILEDPDNALFHQAVLSASSMYAEINDLSQVPEVIQNMIKESRKVAAKAALSAKADKK